VQSHPAVKGEKIFEPKVGHLSHQSAHRRSELDTGLCLLMDLLQTDTSQVGAANYVFEHECSVACRLILALGGFLSRR
jgi:hypothetical protein